MKTAFVFAGQGAQYPGMMMDICREIPEAEMLMDMAESKLGRPIRELCARGTIEDLSLTENTQPCVLAADLVAWLALKSRGIYPDGVAGFSLGEYAAVTAANVIRVDETFGIIYHRADIMQKAIPVGTHMMAALKTGGEDARKLCEAVGKRGVWVSNYNAPDQTVVAGTAEGIDRLMEIAKECKIQALRLPVSVISHCEPMRAASEELKDHLEKISYKDSKIPVYMNCTGKPAWNGDEIKKHMIRQLYSPVRWIDTINAMMEDGYDTFIECGPGKTLSKFIKKILYGKNALIYHVENMQSLNETIKGIKGHGNGE